MIKVFKQFEKKEWGLIALAVIFIIFQVWLDLKLPEYMSEITILVQTEGSAMSDILTAGVKMVICALGSFAGAGIVAFLAANVAASLSKTLRKKLYDKTLSFSMAEINKFSTSSLITRSTNDINQIQMLVAMGLQAIIKAPITAVWAVMKIMGKSWQWTAATAAAVLLLIIMISVIVTFAIPKFKVVQKLTDNLNRITRENLTGIRVVRAYNAEKYQEDKFGKANDELTKTNMFVNRVMAIMNGGMSFIMSGITLAIYIIGAVLINNAIGADKMLLFSDMVVFSNYAVQVIMSFMMVSMIFIMLPRASVSAGRIMEVLETPLTIVPGTKEGSDSGKVGEVELRNISFKYPDAEEYILRDINVNIKKGETVAFIGATGSGKSTLINLIPRFYDVTEGEVLVDGINVKDYKPESLNDKLGYVSQRAVLFSGTVASNVAYGEKAGMTPDEEQIQKAISVAQAEEFVSKMEGNTNAHISQGGSNVSGGQKQRLSVARAVGREPEIYIFDDTFSALDYKTDKALRKAIGKETAGSTVIIVAQRIGTIRHADKIIVLEEGKMAGVGTHDELMKSCDIYREIALSQLPKEELANA